MRLLLVAGAGIALTAMLTSLSGLPGEPPSREGLPWEVADVMLAGIFCLFLRLPISGTNGALAGRMCIVKLGSSATMLIAAACTTVAVSRCGAFLVTELPAVTRVQSSSPKARVDVISLAAVLSVVERASFVPLGHWS
jgi:hypothetical protein